MKAEIAKAIKDTGAQGMKDMGKVMGVLKQRFAGAWIWPRRDRW